MGFAFDSSGSGSLFLFDLIQSELACRVGLSLNAPSSKFRHSAWTRTISSDPAVSGVSISLLPGAFVDAVVVMVVVRLLPPCFSTPRLERRSLIDRSLKLVSSVDTVDETLFLKR